MRIEVTFRNLAPSEALRTYAQDKIGRIRRYLPKGADGGVTLSLDGFRHVAEASFRGTGAGFAASETSTDDMYAAIDLLADKLSRQARRRKDKLRDHRATPLAHALPVGPTDE